jgi:TolB protein
VQRRAIVALALAFGLAGCQSTAPSTTAPAGGATPAPSAVSAATTTPAAEPSASAAASAPAPTAAPTPAPTIAPFRGIVYDEYAGGRNYISTIQPDGTGHHRLPNPDSDIEPTLSPSGQQIAFHRLETASEPGIYLMNVDGADVHRVVDIPGHALQSPAWSPDGKKLAFIELTNPDAQFPVWALYIVKVDGTGLQKLTTTLGDRPAWSPDGKKIAFARSSAAGIWTLTLATKALKQLTTGTDTDAAWSPDGTRIAFERQDDSNPANVVHHIFEATSGGLLVVQETTATLDDSSPVWSPDSTEILFSRLNTNAKADLELLKSNGTVVAVTKTATISELTPSWR